MRRHRPALRSPSRVPRVTTGGRFTGTVLSRAPSPTTSRTGTGSGTDGERPTSGSRGVWKLGPSEDYRALLRGEISADEYVRRLKADVDRRRAALPGWENG